MAADGTQDVRAVWRLLTPTERAGFERQRLFGSTESFAMMKSDPQQDDVDRIRGR